MTWDRPWLMGQAGGGAIADVLFGLVNPCGKLAETFPCKVADTPAYLNFPGDTEVRYGEGLFIGYRYYEAKDVPVLFPFGHGLSYTTFEYSNLQVSATEFNYQDGLTVSVDVSNTGTVAGKEIVQLYLHDRQASLIRPPKELKGFAKLTLQPGQTKTATLQLDFRAFAYYHPGYGQWITEDGNFDILIGASSADIRCQMTVTLKSTLELPSLLDRESTVGDWLADSRGRIVFEPLYQQMLAGMAAMMGQGEDEGEEDSAPAIGMDMLGFLKQTPLLSILHFQENALPKPADEIVDRLLAQAHS
jgi:beta-glucosidase